jgi:N6-L-threonylcarbamoyladenine synthase
LIPHNVLAFDSLPPVLYRYCIDNGAMIAQAGIFAFQTGQVFDLEQCTCTQR